MQINPNHTQSDSPDTDGMQTEEAVQNPEEGDIETSPAEEIPEDVHPEQDAMTDSPVAISDDDAEPGDNEAIDAQALEPEAISEVTDSAAAEVDDESEAGNHPIPGAEVHEPQAVSEAADSDDGAVDPADEGELRGILEALIFASDEPLTFKQIKDLLAPEQQEESDEETAPGGGRRRQTRLTITRVKRGIDHLNAEYEESGRAFRIIEVSGGFAFQTTGDFGAWVGRLFAERSRRRLTQSALETLSIIAFKQPISKPAIEGIRGVNAEYVVKSLLERNLISIVGREDSPGRPLLYGTTKNFLKHFGLSSINDLPKPREIEDLLSSEDELGVNPIDEMDPGQAMSLTNMSSQELERLFDTARLRTETRDGGETGADATETDGLTGEDESVENGGLRVMLDVGEAAADELAAHAAVGDGIPADALEIEQDLSEWSEDITDGVDEEMVEEYFGEPHDMPDDDIPEDAQPSDTDDDEEDDEDDDETEDRVDDEDDLYDDEDEDESDEEDDDDDDGFIEADVPELTDEIPDSDESDSADIVTDAIVDFGDFDPDFLSDDDSNDSEDETDTDTEETDDGNNPFDTDIPEEDEEETRS